MDKSRPDKDKARKELLEQKRLAQKGLQLSSSETTRAFWLKIIKKINELLKEYEA